MYPPHPATVRISQSVTANAPLLLTYDGKYWDHAALSLNVTRNSGTETLTVYRSEGVGAGAWTKMESLQVFSGSGSSNHTLNLRHRMFRLEFEVDASPADYTVVVGVTLRRRLSAI
jgi:hypothetical protein